MAGREMNRWNLEAILNRELHRHTQCASCRFVGFETWDGENSIFDHISLDCGDMPANACSEIVEKIIAEATCTYEDVAVE
jgi:hypothetical protein